jgi:hypothetical protein
MTILDMFFAVSAALLINSAVTRAISEILWYLHKRKHGSILNSIIWDEPKPKVKAKKAKVKA